MLQCRNARLEILQAQQPTLVWRPYSFRGISATFRSVKAVPHVRPSTLSATFRGGEPVQYVFPPALSATFRDGEAVLCVFPCLSAALSLQRPAWHERRKSVSCRAPPEPAPGAVVLAENFCKVSAPLN